MAKKKTVKKRKPTDPVVFIPEDAEVNFDDFKPMSPPKTEYESRRTDIGRDAYKQITGK